jgi:hypothetical protein
VFTFRRGRGGSGFMRDSLLEFPPLTAASPTGASRNAPAGGPERSLRVA